MISSEEINYFPHTFVLSVYGSNFFTLDATILKQIKTDPIKIQDLWSRLYSRNKS